MVVKKMPVKKMTEGAMSHIMEQGGDSEQGFDVGECRDVPDCPGEGGIHVPGVLPGEVHGAQYVLEPAVFRRGIDPSRALQLIDIPKTLDPRRIDEIFFRGFVRVGRRIGNGEVNVVVDRVSNQRNAMRCGCGHDGSSQKRADNPTRSVPWAAGNEQPCVMHRVSRNSATVNPARGTVFMRQSDDNSSEQERGDGPGETSVVGQSVSV